MPEGGPAELEGAFAAGVLLEHLAPGSAFCLLGAAGKKRKVLVLVVPHSMESKQERRELRAA